MYVLMTLHYVTEHSHWIKITDKSSESFAKFKPLEITAVNENRIPDAIKRMVNVGNAYYQDLPVSSALSENLNMNFSCYVGLELGHIIQAV